MLCNVILAGLSGELSRVVSSSICCLWYDFRELWKGSSHLQRGFASYIY